MHLALSVAFSASYHSSALIVSTVLVLYHSATGIPLFIDKKDNQELGVREGPSEKVF
jgi:hypothetical protein